VTVSPPEDPSLSPEEELLSRKKEIVQNLRALADSPGWQYLCTVLRQQGLNIKYRLLSAGSLDDLLKVNLDLREAETYEYCISAPDKIIEEFTQALEASDDD
jgi:hypothetical protein